jgi:hypothetical protein
VNGRHVLAALAVLAVAGCSSSSSGGSSQTAQTLPPTSTTPTASASVSPSASPSPTPTPTFSTTVKASQHCLSGNLSIALGGGQGAAGTTFVSIVFTNTGSKPCTLYGYPGVSFLDSSGKPLGVPATHSGGEEGVVTLAPKGTANAQLGLPDTGNFSAADCQQATSAQLQVYPPGDFSALTIADKAQICTTSQGATSITPVTPGSGG